MRHSSLRTSIERTFGLLKAHFRVLDSRPFWSYQTQVDVVIACCILHNHIMGVDPEDGITEEVNTTNEPTTQRSQLSQREEMQENREWAIKRDMIANSMWNDFIRIDN
ncbi:hypothetical protein M5689_025146 [Euphorbia peplus]|nr:hypothetical protein M5689_025146 [Euphorbia peplus]